MHKKPQNDLTGTIFQCLVIKILNQLSSSQNNSSLGKEGENGNGKVGAKVYDASNKLNV